jgi:hypothetical protein
MRALICVLDRLFAVARRARSRREERPFEPRHCTTASHRHTLRCESGGFTCTFRLVTLYTCWAWLFAVGKNSQNVHTTNVDFLLVAFPNFVSSCKIHKPMKFGVLFFCLLCGVQPIFEYLYNI